MCVWQVSPLKYAQTSWAGLGRGYGYLQLGNSEAKERRWKSAAQVGDEEHFVSTELGAWEPAKREKLGDWLPFASAKVQKLSLLTNVCSPNSRQSRGSSGNFAKAFLNLNKRNLLATRAHVQLGLSLSLLFPGGNFSNAINFCTQRGGREWQTGGKSFWRRRSLCFSHPSWHNAQISVAAAAAACGIWPGVLRPSGTVFPLPPPTIMHVIMAATSPRPRHLLACKFVTRTNCSACLLFDVI